MKKLRFSLDCEFSIKNFKILPQHILQLSFHLTYIAALLQYIFRTKSYNPKALSIVQAQIH